MKLLTDKLMMSWFVKPGTTKQSYLNLKPIKMTKTTKNSFSKGFR